MRIFILFACTFIFSALAVAQTPARPRKVLTPEQQAIQQQTRIVDAKRQQLRAQAKQVFDAEMASEKAGDCPGAQTTMDFNTCFDKAVTLADQRLKTYEEALEGLLTLHVPGDISSGPPGVGVEGEAQTPEQHGAEFERLEQLWRTYLDAASKAAFHQFDGGSGAPSFALETHLRLVRSHLRELDMVYGGLLRL